MQLTGDKIAAIISVVISAALEFLPGMSWFDNLAGKQKRLVVGLACAVVAFVVWLSSNPALTLESALNMLWTIALSIAANQGFHSIFKSSTPPSG